MISGNAVVASVPNATTLHQLMGEQQIIANNNTLNNLEFSKPVNPILGTQDRMKEPPMTSVGPTMWLGAQNGMLYVHSSVGR